MPTLLLIMDVRREFAKVYHFEYTFIMLSPVIFDRLGLPKYSGKIFATLEKHGPLLVTHIATRINTHRPAIYRALLGLEVNHFVRSEKIGGRTYYSAAAESKVTQAFTAISKSATIRARSETQEDTMKLAHIRILLGRDGLRAAFDDVVMHTPRGETFYRYTSEKDLARADSYLSREYRTIRDSKKLERLVISNPRSGKQKRPRLERFIKYIPEEFDHFDQDIIQITYGKRIAFIDLNTERAFIIENAPLADFQKVIFKMLYKTLAAK